MRYEEVRVELFPAQEGRFEARVSYPDRSTDPHLFVPPDGIKAESLYREWIAALRQDYNAKRAVEERRAEAGHRLYQALFADSAGAFRERLIALDQREADEELCGLRLRLVMGDAVGEGNLNASTLLPVSSLPWELMNDRGRGRLLARSRHVSIVRTIGAADPPRSAKVRVEGKLRVLVVDAQPEGSAPLNWPAEKAKIKKALGSWKYAKVEFLDHASFEATCRRLADGAFHVLHFIGHGGFDRSSGQCYLLFEKERKKDWVLAQDVADRFGDIKTLKVAVLNACRTGQLADDPEGDPLGGVAAALSVRGVPIVVAMQIPVTDSMAIEFADAFYSTLKNGLPVEAAVAQGRLAVRLSSPEWATPVLYLRGGSSDLFEVRPAPDEAEESPVERSAEPIGAPDELKLGIRSFVESKDLRLAEWAVKLNETTERFLPLEELFDGRFIREPQAWGELLLPRLEDFLRDAVYQHRPLTLCLAAHATLAFACGYYFHTKAGAPLTLVQMTRGRARRWSEREGVVPPGPLWEDFEQSSLDEQAEDIAVAVEITRRTAKDAEEYIKAKGLPVGRLIRASIAGEPGKAGVESGAHAFQLAWSLHQWLKDQTGDRTRRRLHLFISAPNGFVFFLGQLARVLGRVQLYEYDFEGTRHGTYEPSLELPYGAAKPAA